jgi:polyvinyl alcohol dehydrogenase (cytochrome)
VKVVVGRAALLGAVLALLAVAPAAADWPVFGHDLTNSRSAGVDGPSPSQAGSMQKAWTFNSSNGDFTGTPVVAGGTLVAGTGLGTVYALDPVTGKQRWSRDLGQPINGSAAIDPAAPGGPTVFVPVAEVGRPRLVALWLATGKVRWQTVLSSQSDSDAFASPTYWNHTVFMGTSGPGNDDSTARGTEVALNEATGKLRWRTYAVPSGHDGGAIWTTPAIDTKTGRLYVGTGNAYHDPAADTTDAMLVLSASSGRILGHFQATAGDVWEASNPTGGPDADFGSSANLFPGPGGRQLVGEGQKNGIYWALDRATMKPVWKTTVGPGGPADRGIGSTAYDGKQVYGSDSSDSQVFSLAPGDGSMPWNSVDGGTAHITPVAVANGVVYSAASHGMLAARDAATGNILSQMPIGGPTFGGISVVGRAVYVAVGVGPPSPILALPSQNTQQADANGSIVAFGDTSSAAPASTFSGSCQLSGTVDFNPPLTNSPQAVDQTARATGTCSGTFTDTAGRDHQLSNAPVTYAATEHADSGSCGGGTDAGSGTMTFQYGVSHFTISETRAGAGVIVQTQGTRSGSAAGVATAGGNPVDIAQQCGGSGMKEAQIGNAEVHTTPSMSG